MHACIKPWATLALVGAARAVCKEALQIIKDGPGADQDSNSSSGLSGNHATLLGQPAIIIIIIIITPFARTPIHATLQVRMQDQRALVQHHLQVLNGVTYLFEVSKTTRAVVFRVRAA